MADFYDGTSWTDVWFAQCRHYLHAVQHHGTGIRTGARQDGSLLRHRLHDFCVSLSATPTITPVNVTSTSVTISWTPFGAGDYTVAWSGAAVGSPQSQAGASSPFTITGLTPGSTLNITVTRPRRRLVRVPLPAPLRRATLCGVPTNIAVAAVTYTSPTGSIQQGLK
jgi:hypothetical protein